MKTDDAIRSRKTIKVLGEIEAPLEVKRHLTEIIAEITAIAGCAPFHYACHKTHREGDRLPSIVPWRFYVLESADCRALLKWMSAAGIDGGKIARMLATADALIQVTWLPDISHEVTGFLFEPSVRNVEHIAAASAAIQNLLLLATARGMDNYWSSGGVLREEAVFNLLNIPGEEQLLGAVFLFPSETKGAEEVPGKLHDLRGEAGDWSRWVKVDA